MCECSFRDVTLILVHCIGFMMITIYLSSRDLCMFCSVVVNVVAVVNIVNCCTGDEFIDEPRALIS